MTSKRKIILCLEDTPSRVRWLETLAKEYKTTVYYQSSVRAFLDLCNTYKEADLTIVLDHDLGGFSMPMSLQDADGLDGIDAVEQMPVFVAPVLIWSTNDTEAPRMEETLRKRGFSTVVRIPWTSDRIKMAAQLHKWLT